jgi:ribosomal protein S9
LPELPRRVTREKRDMFFKMSTPSKRVRKASTATVVLTPGDNDMIANFTNRFEKYFKLKNEILNSSANAVADLKRVLESDPNFSILVKRCPVSASIDAIRWIVT